MRVVRGIMAVKLIDEEVRLNKGGDTMNRKRKVDALAADERGNEPRREAVEPRREAVSRGNCSVCGEPVLFTQERRKDGATGVYRHANASECIIDMLFTQESE